MKKSASFVLLAVILLQSCVVYQDTSVSVNDAQNQGATKVLTTYGTEMVFDNMYIKDSIYYGVYESQEIRLDTTQIKNIYLRDKKKSNTRTVLAILSPLILYGAFLVIMLTGYFVFGG